MRPAGSIILCGSQQRAADMTTSGKHRNLRAALRGCLPERAIREVGEIQEGNVYFGEDLMEIPFGSPAPAKLD